MSATASVLVAGQLEVAAGAAQFQGMRRPHSFLQKLGMDGLAIQASAPAGCPISKMLYHGEIQDAQALNLDRGVLLKERCNVAGASVPRQNRQRFAAHPSGLCKMFTGRSRSVAVEMWIRGAQTERENSPGLRSRARFPVECGNRGTG